MVATAIVWYPFLVMSPFDFPGPGASSDGNCLQNVNDWTLKLGGKSMDTSEGISRELELSSIPEIRRVWHKGEWYYSAVDVVGYLAEPANARVYWGVLKERLIEKEGLDKSSIEQLKLQAEDNRFRLTDTMNRQSVLRLLQSIPSTKAEPFRL